MTPVRFIRKIASEADTIDLEDICARLEHHDLKMTVRNNFLSDVGDRWICTIHLNMFNDENTECSAPTLRRAVIGALDAYLELEKQNKEADYE